MFHKFLSVIELSSDLYSELSAPITFEPIAKDRLGAVLVLPDKIYGMPLVRTTTCYNNPPQIYMPVHHELAQRIGAKTGGLQFNNALVEIYEPQYKTMRFHSDQAIDLQSDSHIALYSCYNNPETRTLRKLIVQSKISGEQTEITLDHNSVVVFSMECNSKFLHKIVLDKQGDPNCRWLGFTFRTAKTFIRFHDERPYFTTGTLIGQMLTMAEPEQRKEFYRCRQHENKEIDYTYPDITYTLSDSDMFQLQLN